MVCAAVAGLRERNKILNVHNAALKQLYRLQKKAKIPVVDSMYAPAILSVKEKYRFQTRLVFNLTAACKTSGYH